MAEAQYVPESGGILINRSRRALAVLSSAATLAAGLVGTLGATAAHASAPSLPGLLAFQNVNDTVGLLSPSGATSTISGFPYAGGRLAWSPDGSRLAAGLNGLNSTEVDGQGVINLNGVGGTGHPAYIWGGSYLLADAQGKLYYQTSDGLGAQYPLLSSAQEPASVCDSHGTGAPDGVIAFTRQAGSCYGSSSIWTYTPSTGKVAQLIAGAADPQFSADGSTLLFTEVVAGQTQVFSAHANGTGVTQLTDEPAGASEPSLSMDGSTLAYTTLPDNGAGQTVVKTLALNTPGATPVVVAQGSYPSWQPTQANAIGHVYGTGGLGTDVAASRADYNTVGTYAAGLVTGYNAVLLNRSDSIDAPDAVALAGEKQAPLLLTAGGSLDTATANELKRTLRKGWTVYLAGGTGELSPRLVAQVQALGYRPVRIAAPDPSTTSVAAAKAITGTPTTVTVADDYDYRTTIGAASFAAAAGYKGRSVLLLNDGWGLPASIQSYLNSLNPKTTRLLAVGSRSFYALQHAPLKQVWHFYGWTGGNGETLTEDLDSYWWGGENVATVVNTSDWQDGAVGAAAAGGYGPLVWTSPSYLDPITSAFLQRESASVSEVLLYGSSGYPVNTIAEIKEAIGYGLGETAVYNYPNGRLAPAPAFRAAVNGGAAAPVAPGALTRGTLSPRPNAAGVSGTTEG